MSLKSWTPCDEIGWDGLHHCPYCDDGDTVDCERYCFFEEDEEVYECDDAWDDWDIEPSRDDWDEIDCDYEMGYDPYLGCFSDDC